MTETHAYTHRVNAHSGQISPHVTFYCAIIKAPLNQKWLPIKGGNCGQGLWCLHDKGCVSVGVGVLGVVIWGNHKIYVAFTVEKVIKRNYKRGSTHHRATAQQADWQEDKKTSDQGLFSYTFSPFVSSSFFLLWTSSRPINQLQQVQALVWQQLDLLKSHAYIHNTVWGGKNDHLTCQNQSSPATKDNTENLNLLQTTQVPDI